MRKKTGDHREVWLAIHAKYDSQADFAADVAKEIDKEPYIVECLVSRVLNARRKLPENYVDIWAKLLYIDHDKLNALA